MLIKDVYYVPSLGTSLISAHSLADKGWDVNFNKSYTYIKKANIKINAYWQDNAYYLKDLAIDYSKLEKVVYSVNSLLKEESLNLLYRRLNHLSPSYLAKTIH